MLPSSASIDGFGNALDNFMQGNNGANTLRGGGGADEMYGRAGNDRFIFDTNDGSFAGDLADGGQDTDSIVLAREHSANAFSTFGKRH